MSHDGQLRCPACGESEGLTGHTVSTLGQGGPIRDIEVTCPACGERWLRGAPTCKACGRRDGEPARQNLTRHPRGILLSVVGARDVIVCPDCDADVIAGVRRGLPVPEGYQPRFLVGRTPAAAPQNAATGGGSRPTGPPSARQRPRISSQVSAPVPRRREAAPITDPTVRQATTAYLEATPGADAVTVTLLGAALGPATRLSSLDRDPARTHARLRDLLERDLSRYHAERRSAVAQEVQAAFGFWNASGWITADAIPDLRTDGLS